jgi:type IV secretion system protein VirB2
MIKNWRKHQSRAQELMLLALIVLPGASHAATIETILNKSVGYLQGPVAKGLGLLAIIGTGYLCVVKQRVPKEQFAMVLLGLGIIFGGSSLYSTLVG